MKIGEKVTVNCNWIDEKPDGRFKRKIIKMETATGTVVYIHPKKRFCRVRFRFPGGSFCECYKMKARGQ